MLGCSCGRPWVSSCGGAVEICGALRRSGHQLTDFDRRPDQSISQDKQLARVSQVARGLAPARISPGPHFETEHLGWKPRAVGHSLAMQSRNSVHCQTVVAISLQSVQSAWTAPFATAAIDPRWGSVSPDEPVSTPKSNLDVVELCMGVVAYRVHNLRCAVRPRQSEFWG